jgi:hypothetical protein
MVFRRAYDTINKVGRAWNDLTMGSYNTLERPDPSLKQARVLLEEVVADWPADVPDTPAVRAARAYLQRARDEG